MKGWVDSPRDEAFEIHSADVCDTYRQAIERAEQGIRTISFDEKTGIQALEPLTAGKPVKPGHIEKREFEYKRHGTQALLAGMDVAVVGLICYIAWILTPNSILLISKPMTISCILSSFEKQIVFLANRLIQVRKFRFLRSIF